MWVIFCSMSFLSWDKFCLSFNFVLWFYVLCHFLSQNHHHPASGLLSKPSDYSHPSVPLSKLFSALNPEGHFQISNSPLLFPLPKMFPSLPISPRIKFKNQFLQPLCGLGFLYPMLQPCKLPFYS